MQPPLASAVYGGVHLQVHHRVTAEKRDGIWRSKLRRQESLLAMEMGRNVKSKDLPQAALFRFRSNDIVCLESFVCTDNSEFDILTCAQLPKARPSDVTVVYE